MKLHGRRAPDVWQLIMESGTLAPRLLPAICSLPKVHSMAEHANTRLQVQLLHWLGLVLGCSVRTAVEMCGRTCLRKVQNMAGHLCGRVGVDHPDCGCRDHKQVLAAAAAGPAKVQACRGLRVCIVTLS